MRGARIGSRFYEALKDSQIDGIAQAARTRARIEREQKKDNPRAGLGFLSLVVLHGDAADHAWMESLATDNVPASMFHPIWQAVARGRPGDR